MLRLLKYLTKREWLMTLAALALIVLQVFLDLALPDYMSQITELVEHEGSEMREILLTGAKMLLAALGALVAAILSALLASRVAASFSATLRVRLFDRIGEFSPSRMQRFHTASLVTRTTNDVLQIQLAVVLALEVLVKAPLMAIWAIVKIRGAAWTGLTAIGFAILALLCIVCIGLCVPRFRRMQTLTDRLGRITQEQLSGLHIVRAYQGERFEEERFEQTNEALTKTHLFTAHTLSVLPPSMQLVSNLLTLAIYVIGVLLINAAATELRIALFSDTVAFLSYMMRIVDAFLLVATGATLLPRAAAAAARVCEVLDRKSEMHEGTREAGAEGLRGEVEISHVTLRYHGAEQALLQDVSFHAHRGECVGIIGASGSSKSILASMIPRFCDAVEGSVLVDGVDVRDYTYAALQARVGYVPQEPFLFSGTVKENIAFGNRGQKSIPEQRLQALLAAVCAEDMVKGLPKGCDTHVTEGALNLSGGEAQRIAIARALCGEPEILVLDDAFSYFDAPSGEQIRRAIADFRPDLTRIIVSQRTSAVRNADRIVVMDGGRVVGIGTHRELLAHCDAYRAIAEAQGEGVSPNA